jgi:hypothetical protein
VEDRQSQLVVAHHRLRRLMRTAAALFALVLTQAAHAVPDRYRPMPSMSYERYERLIKRLLAHPPKLSNARLPDGFRIGRCLLEVDGRTLISGPCSYTIEAHSNVASRPGDFEFNGPHQVFSGIDYPEPEIYSEEISTDYFVQVDHELLDGGSTGPGWEAHWNEDKAATHAQSQLGHVTRKGACYSNARTRICLWKK